VIIRPLSGRLVTMSMFDLPALDDATATVRTHLPPTPQYAWPLLGEALGAEVWVKHENHTRTGAFKVRGGLVLQETLRRAGDTRPIVTSTRGNHGQSLALTSKLHGRPVTIVVPEGNDPDQNAAMRGFGADVVVHGADYQAAREHAAALAEERDAMLVPPFHPELVRGVATYAKELFDAAGELDAVYVPLGMGSGLCGMIAVRDLLGLTTQVVGVVADGAPAYALSYAAGHVVATETVDTFADGVATRSPDAAALEIVLKGAADVVRVTDDEIAAAIRLLYRTTKNVAEGAGAVATAGLAQRAERHRGQRVGVVLSGGNISAGRLVELLREPA
jgi:threonine dehydratase